MQEEMQEDILKKLLEEWDCICLYDNFKDKGIDIECLKSMTLEDINELISINNLGMRIRFRQRLFEWRHLNGFVTPLADTIACSSRTASWINESILAASPNSSQSPTKTELTILPSSSGSKPLNLENLLGESFLGKGVILYFEKKKSLSRTTRNDLCTVIAKFWVAERKHVIDADYQEAFREIKKLFPKEKEETYLNTCTKAKGRLAARYYTLSRKYQRKGILQSRYKLKSLQSSQSTSSNVCNNETVPPSIIEDIQWLKKNFEPEKLVTQAWIRTHSYRMKQAKDEEIDVLKEWPILKQNFSYYLIDLDFENIYPEKDKLLSLKWDKYTGKILTIFKDNIKDEYCKNLLNQIVESTPTETIDYLSLYLLPAILQPTIIHTEKRRWNLQF